MEDKNCLICGVFNEKEKGVLFSKVRDFKFLYVDFNSVVFDFF